jgi:thioredoxin 1
MKVLRFTASWCVPCKNLAKMLDEIENKPNIEVIDVDERSDVAIEYGIRSVPTMIKMDENNNVLDRFVGTKTQIELEKWLNG